MCPEDEDSNADSAFFEGEDSNFMGVMLVLAVGGGLTLAHMGLKKSTRARFKVSFDQEIKAATQHSTVNGMNVGHAASFTAASVKEANVESLTGAAVDEFDGNGNHRWKRNYR